MNPFAVVMARDLVWSFAPVTLVSRFLGVSIASFTERCRNEICTKYAQFLFCTVFISGAVVLSCTLFYKSDFSIFGKWTQILLTVSLYFCALLLLWKTLKHYKLIILMFENMKSVDK